MTPRATTASVSYINAALGLHLSPSEICTYLTRMSLHASPSPSAPEEVLDVQVPPTRPDILHECDIMEDVGIAYGFNNLPKGLPPTNTVAKPLPLNKLGDILRRECASAGWVEVLPLILVRCVAAVIAGGCLTLARSTVLARRKLCAFEPKRRNTRFRRSHQTPQPGNPRIPNRSNIPRSRSSQNITGE